MKWRGTTMALWAARRGEGGPAAGRQRVRSGLAWWAQLANLGDLGTTYAAMALGGHEVGLVPAFLIARGYPTGEVVLAIKVAAALTIWGLWKAAGASVDASIGRISVLSGIGGLAVLAGILTWVAAHNLLILMAVR